MKTSVLPASRPLKGPRGAAVLLAVVGAVAWAGCGGTGGATGPDLPGTDPGSGSESDVPLDSGRDETGEVSSSQDTTAEADGVPVEEGAGEDLPDGGHTGDPPERDIAGDPLVEEADPGDGEEPVSDAPGCLPDEMPCPCGGDEDCPEGFFCAGDRCRPWVCWPGATTCLEHLRILCDRNGGGYLVLEDCDDRNACTLGDGCAAGTCLPRTAKVCDDGNPCTADRCDPDTGECRFEPVEDLPCDDQDPCTTGDRCLQGACVPRGPLFCGDGNPCTDDLCTSLLGCVHLPVDRPCALADPRPCTAGGTCREGRCEPVDRDCDDGDPCTDDDCDPANGACRHRAIPGCACITAGDCDDGDPCTDDDCGEGRCLHEARAALPCCRSALDCPVEDPCIETICENHRCTGRPLETPACCRNPDRRWDFENGLEDWTPSPDQGPVRWRWMPAPDGSGALCFGREDGTAFDDGSRTAGAVLSAPVAIPPGVQTRIRWRTWLDVEDAPGRNLLRLEAAWDGQVVGIWERPAGFPMRLWQWVEADLSVLGGRTVTLRFSFDSVDDLPGPGQGVFVDDVSVQSSCAPAPCTADRDCLSLGRVGECLETSCGFRRVLRTLRILGEEAGTLPALANPSDVVPAPDGSRLFVSDRDAHVVRVLDLTGREVRTLGGPGQEPGRLASPRGLAWSGDLLWIADSQNHRVQALTPSGVPVLVLGRKGSGPGELLDPRDVTLSEDGERVFVADTGNHRVQAFSRWGVARFAAGSYGTSNGRFRSPSCVALLPGERLLVCDSQNNRLQVLGPDGGFLAVIRPLQGPAFSLPYQAAVAPDGSVWVADSQNHRVVRMTLEGRVLWTFGAYGSGPEEFRFPMGLAPLGSGEGWVVDSGNRRLVLLGFGPWP